MSSNTSPNYWIGRKITRKLAKKSGQSRAQVRKDLAFFAGAYYPDMNDREVVLKFRNVVLDGSEPAPSAV